jgi:hypothetical protein
MVARQGARIVALLIAFTSTAAYAQGNSARISSADSAIIAREIAAWAALQRNDSGAAFVRVAGNSPAWILVQPNGISRTSTAEVARGITTNCDRQGTPQLDSARVDHITEGVVLLTYRTTVHQRCGAETAFATRTIYSMTVWARRGDQWQLVAQSVTPPAGAAAR